MSQSTEPRALDRQEPDVVVERATPAADPAPVPAGFDHSERTEQATRSTAGIEQRERVVTNAAGLAHHERSTQDVGAEQRQSVLKIGQVVWLFVGVIEVLIGMRVLLKFIGANPENEFAGLVYNAAGVFLAPFFSLTGSPSSGAMVLEIPSLIAMLAYALLGWVIVRRILPLFDRPTTRSTSTYDRYRS